MNVGGLDETFFLAWANACGRLGIDPFDLIRVSYSESGVMATAHNPNGHASGLIQFMPQTLLGLGWYKGHDEFRKLTATEQVPFVERYYRPYAAHCKSDALAYVATFLPALLPKAAEVGDSFVLCGANGPLAWAYRDNPALDRNKDGLITVADMGAQLELACRGSRYDAIVFNLRQAMGLEPAPIPEPPPTEPDLSRLGDESLDERRDALSDAVEQAARDAVDERAKG